MAFSTWSQIDPKTDRGYLWSRPIDLLFIAGPGSLLFALVALPLTLAWRGGADGLVTLFLHLGAICNYPHYAITYQLVWRERDKKPEVFRWMLVSGALMAAVGGAALQFPNGLVPLVVTTYLAWSAHHYAAQHFGVAAMYAARNGAPLGDRERSLIQAGFLGIGAFMLLVTVTARPVDTALFGVRADEGVSLVLQLLPSWAYPLELVLAAAAIVAFVVGDARLRARTAEKGARASSMLRMLFATNVLWFVVPQLRAPWSAHMLVGDGVSTWAPFAIPFFHCSQYLGVCAWRNRLSGTVKPVLLYLGIAALGLLLFEGLTTGVTKAFSIPEARSLALVPACLNIHHFVVDGVMWKRKRAPKLA